MIDSDDDKYNTAIVLINTAIVTSSNTLKINVALSFPPSSIRTWVCLAFFPNKKGHFS